MKVGTIREHARVLSAVVFGVLLVGAAYFLRVTPSDSSSGVEVVAVAPREYQNVEDTDGDGVSDWQEELLGSNPEKPDAPRETTSSTTKKQTLDDLPDTYTNRFGVGFMNQYLSDKYSSQQTGSTFDSKDFINSAVSAAQQDLQVPPITRSDITITSDTDMTAIRDYGNALGAGLQRYPRPTDNELQIFSDAVKTQDRSKLAALDPIIDSYAHTLADLKTLPVPVSMVNEHLALLNSLQAIHNDVAGMKGAFDDPLPALVRTQSYYTKDLGDFVTALRAFRSDFEGQGITYTQDEAGWLFFKI